MQHLPILPILIPMLAGVLMLLPPIGNSINRHRFFSVSVMIGLVIASALLLLTSHQQGTQMYVLGGWQPPFGIVLVADRLSTMMVLLTSVLSLGALLYACAGDDNDGMYFHPLFMFLVMGVNGAFLTGDIFNLFVFFEVLLIASYALLIHGGGKQKTKANVHYVILNLVGSSIFLFALGILYGTIGSLNIADMAVKVRLLDEPGQALVKAGGLLLLVVFGLKAAMLPLHFWLPRTYAAASAPVAALFAIMTKVGIYSILRVHTVIFGEDAGALASIAVPWLWPLALLTLVIGAIGVLASPSLRLTVANLVIVSVGTLLVAIAMHRESATSAALYYMIHTTLVTGALFLLADLVSKQRGKAEDRYVIARKMKRGKIIGIAFFIAALIVVGMPPLSGFVGKVLILQSAQGLDEIAWVWPIVLLAGLASLIAISRAGTTIFWRYTEDSNIDIPIAPLRVIAIVLLLSASPLLVIFGGPVTDYTNMAATQLHDTTQSVDALIPGGSE
ncbi:monovalent cation/H+ antiporter subunit D [Alkalimarinus alittae]|uniref:Monovalent cation/H+ antiporter subunit D n=1 Tax=Alkalimarinus alittae TaxID=2961619 RepID=A0ABY6N2N8_9ALTE|nr:monovalent cation/H+ antiporter subunit D [Alkalimarinus alittae]UZE96285.1 monovalent cation/H+ antiporter subunit D [Alkalimarinus alittae]